MENVTRIGVSLEPDLLKKFDKLIEKKGYGNRSKAMRDLIRKALVTETYEKGDKQVYGTITMVYDHHVGGLTSKLLQYQHDYRNNIMTTSHVHLDHDNCLEVVVVKGKAKSVKEMADKIASVRGVRHGELSITGLE
ncbi:MAG: nickel-responsive transcriptional regulator NikR [Methanobacteriota archaeon]|nr:MAG: nickel-responsive transcriptional regulator NikR [Euryarchaeota archaeon]